MGKDNKYTIEALRKGVVGKDVRLLDAIYEENYPGICQLVCANSGGEEDAQDVFQEVMIILYRKLLKDDFTLSASLSTFLYAIARRVWLRELHMRSRMPAETIDEGHEDADSVDRSVINNYVLEHERLTLYRRKFDELSEDCKRVLRMFLNSIPIREITLAMGYKSDQHTKNRKFRCKEWLIRSIKSSKEYKESSYGKTETD